MPPLRVLSLFALLLGLWVALCPFGTRAAESGPRYTRTEDLIYGRKFGTALTLDVFTPEKPNGAAVLYLASGGFFSAKEMINPRFAEPFLARGYTVFAIVHGSQPRYIIPEIQQDIHRAVRWVRFNAARWKLDPRKFGIMGASAGGHLSLTLGTQGGPGPADAKDPVDRESSAVQAVACFFPPVDFANWGAEGDDAVGVGTLKDFQPAFGPRSATPESRAALSREISPIHYVTAKSAPALIFHGDADKLVPIRQARIYAEKAIAAGAVAEIVIHPRGDHGWPNIEQDLESFADWFDRHLLGK